MSEQVSQNMLHIYAQEQWHDEAFVVGDRDALRALGEALMRAADGGQVEIATVCTSDGEGYDVVVLPMTDEQMHMAVTNSTGKIEDARVASMGDFWRLQMPYTNRRLTGKPHGIHPEQIMRLRKQEGRQ